MAIQFEDLIIDRPLQGIFENSLGDIIGGVNQLQNVSIETTSETKDKTDAVGALIMRFFTSKSVEISAENAVFSTSLAALQFGQDKEIASNSNKILMPRIFTINTDTLLRKHLIRCSRMNLSGRHPQTASEACSLGP